MNYLAYSWIDKGINIEKGLKMLLKANTIREDDGYIIDSLGNKNKYYWIHNSEGMMKDEIVRKENEIREIAYKEKKSRGRPPSKKIPYGDIDWADYAKNKKLNNLSLPSLKEYLS